MDYEVGVKGCPWDPVIARSYGSSDRIVRCFSVEVLDEGFDEFLEATGFQWVRRPTWNRFRAISKSLEVEMCGF